MLSSCDRSLFQRTSIIIDTLTEAKKTSTSLIGKFRLRLPDRVVQSRDSDVISVTSLGLPNRGNCTQVSTLHDDIYTAREKEEMQVVAPSLLYHPDGFFLR